MHWTQYENTFNLICKIKKTMNKIINYLVKNYWDDNDLKSRNFIVEVFKEFMLHKLNFNFEDKVNFALNSKNNYLEKYIRETKIFLENLANKEMDEFLIEQKNQGIINKRNGYRARIVKTIFGEIELKIPRDRLGKFFPSFLQKYFAYLSDLIKKVCNDLMISQNQQSCIKQYKNNGININKNLTSTIFELLYKKALPIYESRKFPSYLDVIIIDSTYTFVIENGPIITKKDPISGKEYTFRKARRVCVMQAYGIRFEDRIIKVNKKNPKIKKIIYPKIDLGFFICDREDFINYTDFLLKIKEQGVKEIKLLVADDHNAIKKAMRVVYPECEEFQLCIAHAKRTVKSFVSGKENKEIIDFMFKQFSDNKIDLKVILEIIWEYINKLDVSDEIKDHILKWFAYNWENIFAFRQYPKEFQRTIYTSNLVESMNKFIKSKTKMKGCSYSTKTLHKQILISKAILLKLI